MLNKFKKMLGKDKKGNSFMILSPVEGNVVPLAKVNDPTFSEGMLGNGAAIIPEKGRVVSPVNGTVSQMFDTGHAVSIVADNGAEILIHVGLDTVKLAGKYFTKHKKDDDAVKQGDLLIEFDIQGIKDEGYDIVTPVVICNTDDFAKVDVLASGNAKELDELIEIVK